MTRTTLLLTLLVPLAGCSSFNRDWKAAAAAPEEARPAAAGIEGRWKGRWHSDWNGHEGDLRCMISRLDDGGLHARYHAVWGPGFVFEYDMGMTVREDGDTFHFSSEADLGLLAGGVYQYEGTVVGDNFHSTYTSKRDHGTFTMTRVTEDEAE